MIYIPKLTPLIENKDVVMTEITYENRFTTVDDIDHDEEHIHDFYEIYVNLSGDVSFLVEDTLYSISRGDVIITAPNEIHRCIYHSDGVHEHFCIWIKDLPFESDILREQFGRSNKIYLDDEERLRLIDLCFTLYKSHGNDSLRFRAAESFFGILDMISTGTENKPIQEQALPSSFSEIIDYISAHFTEPTLSVNEICKNFYISKSTLCRRFKNYFQTTPSDYIDSKRFSEAKKLLSSGQSVQNACLNSGFSDCSYFIMRFRKKFGVTPYKYQRELS